MKLYKSFLTGVMAVAALLLAACSSDGYWDAYNDSEARYTFVQSTSNFSFAATDQVSSVSIFLRRSQTEGSVTLPLSVEFSSDVLSGPQSVTFADGSNTAEYVISVGEIEFGVEYTAELSFADSTAVSGTNTSTVSLSKDYTWVNAGSVEMYSDWAGNLEGDPVTVPVQRAEEYNGNLYRLVSPYWYLESEYAKEGAHVQFYLDENYNALTLPRVQFIGEDPYCLMYMEDGSYGCAFTNEGNTYIIEGLWAQATATGYGLVDYAYEVFVWTEGWPGE